MNKLKKIFLRLCCFVLSFPWTHNYEQIYDNQGNWALVCRWCRETKDVHLYQEREFSNERSSDVPEILQGSIFTSFLDPFSMIGITTPETRGVKILKRCHVASVAEAI